MLSLNNNFLLSISFYRLNRAARGFYEKVIDNFDFNNAGRGVNCLCGTSPGAFTGTRTETSPSASPASVYSNTGGTRRRGRKDNNYAGSSTGTRGITGERK